MSDTTVQNQNATPQALFNKAAEMTSTSRSMSGMEYEMDTIAQLVINLINDYQTASGTISSETQARLTDLGGFMNYSSINFTQYDAGSPMETWKIPYAIGLKAEVRNIQNWYLATKIRIFGNVLISTS